MAACRTVLCLSFFAVVVWFAVCMVVAAVWVIAFWFIRRSMQLERDEVAEIRGQESLGDLSRS